MFEKASRLKLRFETSRGILATEDLWDLPLSSVRGTNLDELAIGLNRQLKDSQTESFVAANPRKDEVLELKFEIVKRVIEVKLAEAAQAKLAADKKAQKQRLLEIIARKQDQQLESTSLEDLQKMVADL